MSEQTVDDLMKELNGQGEEKGAVAPGKVKVENVDVVPEAPYSDPLETKKPTHVSAVQVADAKHSTAVGGKGYAVTVAGDFYAPSKDVPGKKTLLPYRLTVNLPSLAGALSVIKNKMLDQLLRKKYGHLGYLGFRTHEIVESRPIGGAPESSNLQYMPRPGLEQYVSSQRIPIDPAIYDDVNQLRHSVMDYAQNVDPQSETSVEMFVKREQERAKDIAERRALAAMNPDLEDAPPVAA